MEDFEWVKNCDEKIVKQLQQLHQRGFQWKTKLRKAVQGSAKKGLDAEKLRYDTACALSLQFQQQR